ncbi:MAG: FixH family protein [Chitinophagaceae bacterium]|nr:FixH family protein [Chitinophagaceae bacterium]MCW5929539.1 FixH family protein [Chitinophagaceae bacterium]
MNWGYKLLIAILGFAGFMAFMVYKSHTTEFQLVEKEYYKSELKYQQVIDAAQRASQLSSQLKVIREGDNIIIRLPEEMKQQPVTGSVWFYCAYDSGMDRKIPLDMNTEGIQVLDARLFTPGNYTVKVEWKTNDLDYYKEQRITI